MVVVFAGAAGLAGGAALLLALQLALFAPAEDPVLHDLRALADEGGTTPDFARRLAAIRERHARKGRFLERLAGIG